jgi:hypothetical protein
LIPPSAKIKPLGFSISSLNWSVSYIMAGNSKYFLTLASSSTVSADQLSIY